MAETEDYKKRRRTRLRIETGIFLTASVLFAVLAVYFLLFYNWNAYRRQDIEESLAVSFMDYLAGYASRVNEDGTKTSVQECSPKETENMYVEEEVYMTEAADGVIYMESTVTDNHYYSRDGITFTPDYAVGDLVCVLEYPGVGIRRGVYTGTWDEIYHDLDMWMVTMARPDMVLGRTHLAIYGHNHTSQNLSFNNLNKAKVGDQFYLYAESGVYTYEVTDIFSDWRNDTTCKYVDDFTIGTDICYIITCGRDYFLLNGSGTRYQDFIVEGQMISHQLISDYTGND